MPAANFYDSPGFDRAAHRRKDRAWLAAALTDPASRFVPVWQSQNLVLEPDGAAPRAAFLRRGDVPTGSEIVFLGLAEGRAYFAAGVAALGAPAGAAFTDLRRVGPLLPRDEGALLAYARGILHWHRMHRFCACCGQPSRPEEAGHVRRCADPVCNVVHFPRTDPAVIMLVHDGGRCLLGRQKAWLAGMHSTLAGFVEPGESLEQAVAREVREETGIAVAEIAYHSSQPWPFPSSLMLGFSARATGGTLSLAGSELEHAAWYERDWILGHADDDQFRLPRKDSIARRLIEEWLKNP